MGAHEVARAREAWGSKLCLHLHLLVPLYVVVLCADIVKRRVSPGGEARIRHARSCMASVLMCACACVRGICLPHAQLLRVCVVCVHSDRRIWVHDTWSVNFEIKYFLRRTICATGTAG